MSEARRGKRAAVTEEQKAARNEARRQKRATMTEEQKAQENARRRKERTEKAEKEQVDFNLKVDDPITDGAFHDFEQNPERSALLFHLNSGLNKFCAVDSLLDDSLDDQRVFYVGG